MRLFVSEFVTSGAWNEADPPASLLREGSAMLGSIVSDLARIPGCRVSTTWDRRFGNPPFDARLGSLEVVQTASPGDEERHFIELCQHADAALIIAPEFDDLLTHRVERVQSLGTASLNCSAQAIRLCADKLALAQKLRSQRLPTIPTQLFDSDDVIPSEAFPLVIKPRFGAGSQETFLVRDPSEYHPRIEACPTGFETEMIRQPFIAGRALSIAALVGDEAKNGRLALEVFPLARQEFTEDGRFGYLGGQVPESIALQHAATLLLEEIVPQIPGLSGYIGFDLLSPRHAPDELMLVEINPRLTTSYLGYRELAAGNLAEYFLPETRPDEPLRWKPLEVKFTADGATETFPATRTRTCVAR